VPVSSAHVDSYKLVVSRTSITSDSCQEYKACVLAKRVLLLVDCSKFLIVLGFIEISELKHKAQPGGSKKGKVHMYCGDLKASGTNKRPVEITLSSVNITGSH